MKVASVGLIGATIWGNRGSEAMLESVVGEIRRVLPQQLFKVFSYYPGRDASVVKDSGILIVAARPLDLALVLLPGAIWAWIWSIFGVRLPRRLLPRAVAELRDCSVLVDLAGIAFSDGREIFLPYNVLCIWPAMMLGVPVVKCSQALGPFRKQMNRLAASLYLSRCRYVFGRGDQTLKNLNELGLPKSCRMEAPDLAFLHQYDYRLSQESRERTENVRDQLRLCKSDSRGIVCLNPSSLVHSKCRRVGIDYTGTLVTIVRELLNRHYGVVLLPTATREASTPRLRNNDIPVIRNVLSALGDDDRPSHLFWVDWDTDFSMIKLCMAEADIVFASRFHGLVAALSLGLPSICFGWGHKYQELMADFGQEEWVQDFSAFRVDTVLDRMQHLFSRRSDVQNIIREQLPAIRHRSHVQIQMVIDLVNIHT